MRKTFDHIVHYFSISLLVICYSCGDAKPGEIKDIVEEPEQMNQRVKTNINEYLSAIGSAGELDDTTTFVLIDDVKNYYSETGYKPVWCDNEAFLPVADSLLLFIKNAKEYGLFPNVYHHAVMQTLSGRFAADTASTGDRRDAGLWSKADVLLTDAFFAIAKHLYVGRLKPDSLSARTDSLVTDGFYTALIKQVKEGKQLSGILHALEPKHEGYVELKHAIRSFLDTADFQHTFTYVSYPYKDSLKFVATLTKRLQEEAVLSWQVKEVDSITLKEALIKLQKNKKLTVDGKFGAQVVRYLNNTDEEKFKRIAINLDRYKLLPSEMPERYIWVNLPAYQLQLWDQDTVRLESRVVVGKPNTRTPLLTSRISDMVVYPQWTIPNSIIMKEIVPALRKNPGYLAKKGYSLMTWEGEEVDPYTIDWTKYKKGIPFRIVQGSGDDNALGIMKFNFPNKYSVYLHDTNQRYLFKNDKRALSHGCVRVQEWEKLTYYISRLDSTNYESDPARIESDSIRVWLGRKEKHVVKVKSKLPVYFRYFTVAAKNGKLVFFEDIYNEDKTAREAYFSTK
ncbi:MAG: L,D-transpeptidase family protein [Lacibacter sp.]